MTGEERPTMRTPMVLGPDEIVNYPLRRAARGYAAAEVDDLLDQLAAQTRDLLAQLTVLRDERDAAVERLAEATETEDTLKRTLVMAQRAAEHSVEEARKQAELIRQRASDRAEDLLARAADQAHELREATLSRARADEADANRRRRDVEEHVDRLRAFAEDHQARLRHHLDLQLERLTGMGLPEQPAVPEPVVELATDPEIEPVDLAAEIAALNAQVAEALDGDDPTPNADVEPEPEPGDDVVAVADEHDGQDDDAAGPADDDESREHDESLFDV